MNRKILIGIYGCLGIILLSQKASFAQSNLKEGSNHFALYTKSGDFALLEKAKKFSDAAYATARDSASYRSNLLRALVYSSLSVGDSNRKLKYPKDPIVLANDALGKLVDRQFNYEHEQEIGYIRKKLSSAYLVEAKRNLANNKYEEAYDNFRQVDRFSDGLINVKHNLAAISQRLGKRKEAISYYQAYMGGEKLEPKHFLILSRLYLENGDQTTALNTLQKGRDLFPNDRDILFSLLNICADNGAYDRLIPWIDDAIAMEPDNANLNYLAGYANEAVGNTKKAKEYYLKVIALDENNYSANLELGILYLKEYLTNTQDASKEASAQKYLLKANELDPNAINALKSLAVLYEKSGDSIQLERVNNQLNQNTF